MQIAAPQQPKIVMPALVAGIHVARRDDGLLTQPEVHVGVGPRHKAGHDNIRVKRGTP